MDEEWTPRTELGRLVANGEIKTISEALHSKLPLKEYQIVDYLIPDLKDEVINIERAQRMTDSGRRMNYSITAVVGNGNGYVGVGRGKAKEAAPAIKKAIDNAKLNIIEIKRGCGSWECGCGKPHTLPFLVNGKSGSVSVTLKPAPQGVGLAVGDVVKVILRMAGIDDAWGFAAGHTKTTVNYALATFDALKKTVSIKINPKINLSTPIYVGGIGNAGSNKD
ncbi:30S ribosomal protein S5 [Picrophilus oshimae]|uniref:Small ribosomal subunit protein uS5 n=2 Tax=Picrophilus torridus (strain ATCC 700027 / DSM 9790 / JCM 10055 / NBRC 100828 / KAW 2/3) TaxID=1122961 RepID=RS5_PICTO|nr:30S ribosomal protein S5 [Picrophilus oshimae]Q6L1A7.1 RecName: Full=Small ribosomal subunit protein uS5; AltName: Full=30S ribosomal protein S5 [Picrophilus oshimae DSM 9789]AAT43245.1 small subunit ribosomal protein S5P [Picrophilus oshimae DSM 9789]SMD30449.1 SSU ribosomal protein S5P [Picrophilus oshimae DSM 9789]